jgi:hypothetical protein
LLFFAATLAILEDYRKHGLPPDGSISPVRRLFAGHARRLWLLLPVTVLWVNIHAMWILSLALAGLYTLDALLNRKRRGPDPLPLVAVLLALPVAASLNPYGPAHLLYPLTGTTAQWQSIKQIQEWQPPDFRQLSMQPFAWLLLICLGVAGASPRRLSLREFGLLAALGWLGLYSGRFIALFGVAAPVVLTNLLDPLWRKVRKRETPAAPPHTAAVITIWVSLAMLAAVLLTRLLLTWPQESILTSLVKDGSAPPPAALEYLKQNRPPGRLFHSYTWGGYLVWALPEYPVFVDGRSADLYRDEIIGQWFQVVELQPGWDEVLDRWGVNVVLLEPGWPAVRGLQMQGWQTVYEDTWSVILTR